MAALSNLTVGDEARRRAVVEWDTIGLAVALLKDGSVEINICFPDKFDHFSRTMIP